VPEQHSPLLWYLERIVQFGGGGQEEQWRDNESDGIFKRIHFAATLIITLIMNV
jgi:hypothetical protein